MYRAITLALNGLGLVQNGKINVNDIIPLINFIDIGFSFNHKSKRHETTLNGKVVEEEIRSPQIAGLVSLVSAIPEVRKKMVELQRNMGKNKGIVMDGRDIGTVVFPEAELKIFMTADPRIRAERRMRELVEKGIKVTLVDVLNNIQERDHIDQTRDTSPLRKADDAIVLDNSHMTIDEQMVWVEKLILEKTS